jgi:hypothetical protein
MEKRKFVDLLATAFQFAKESLKDQPFGDRIMRKMEGCFQMGSNEQLDTFFSELGLAIGDRERAAIKARNAPAHGGAAATEQELIALHRHSVTYKVLFERVFLKILGHEGKYIDRATLGFPLRNLDEPIGDAEVTSALQDDAR